MGINILKFMPRDVLQESTDRENCTGTQPTAHVVARHVIQHRFARNLKDIVLQLFQIRYTEYLLFCHGVTEYEIAKTHVLLYEVMKIDIEFRRVLVDEMKAFSLSLRTIDGLGRIENQRHILVAPTNLTEQLQPCFRVAFLHMRQSPGNDLHGKTGIRNHAQRILVILLVDLHRLLIVGGQHNLWAPTLALRCRVRVECLCRESLRLGENIIIEVWQY